MNKAMLALGAGVIEGGILVSLPTYYLGIFDEHTAMFLLLAIYCPFVLVPLLCATTLLLKPQTPVQRLWLPALLAFAFSCTSAWALASRDVKIHSSQFTETLWFVIAWLGAELALLVIPASFLLTRTTRTPLRIGLSLMGANIAAAGIFLGLLLLAPATTSLLTFIGTAAVASILTNTLAYRMARTGDAAP